MVKINQEIVNKIVGKSIIECINLKKTIGDRVILDNINLNIPQRAIVGLQGVSGIGKTSLLHILGLLDSEYEGGLRVLGKSISGNVLVSRDVESLKDENGLFEAQDRNSLSDEKGVGMKGVGMKGSKGLSNVTGGEGQGLNAIQGCQVKGGEMRQDEVHDLHDLRKKIAFIYQNHCLLNDLSIYENIILYDCIHNNPVNKSAVLEKIDFLNLDLNKNIAYLSGGERQRVGIARAILQNPRILFADEITNSLDGDMKVLVMNKLVEISRDSGMTVIFVSHDEKILSYADIRVTLF